MPNINVKSLYYITHINNLPSILENGILSHRNIDQNRISFVPIYDSGIVSRRQYKQTPNQKSLWDYANLYFQSRNPMMYRVIHEQEKRNIVVISVKPTVLKKHGVLITDGNAANEPTRFFAELEGMKVLQSQWSTIQSDWWQDIDGSKRKIMAECLVPDQIGPDLIQSIYVSDHSSIQRVKSLINMSIPVIPEPHLFFQPKFAKQIGSISLIDGDMFFSNMQTLTISVNLQGIMGKGLASRAKYQFPDLYVFYQDACRAKNITASKPFLYRREASLDEELADLTVPLKTPNAIKWFLLFATKRRWRDNSRLDDIHAGLEWIRENAIREGIQSLALPALGCGLGNLTWAQVGPLMCRVLSEAGIPIAIYLPREHEIKPKQLTEQFLLGK